MRLTEQEARAKWCPFVRIEGNNRIYNTMTDGFDPVHLVQHCLGSLCMAWRTFQYSHMHGGGELQTHGYCGLAGRPEAVD